ncbi:FecR family protein [Parapedobacter luteus]|uniref:FecR family protein n=1 Tax=Parapedobacter luteus TaxID=623280 RepID=A0A1T5CT46_9SPHI|nr:FecR family protein [Parapedobacter luteus]SKB62513.1 FecR family protein [Parapedobacter luteus]
MEQAVIAKILKYLQREESPEELEEVLRYLRDGGRELEAALEQYAKTVIDEGYEAVMTDDEIDRLQARIRQQITTPTKDVPTMRPERKIRRWLPYVAAAILALVAGGWFFFGDAALDREPGIVQVPDITPGGNHARITLADGRVIDLDTVAVGLLALEQGMAIKKDENGLITYETQGDVPDAGALASNTITTPRGGQYRVVLPDGSQVWLNAASTLKYPLRFEGEARVVELEGEGYFDVSKLKHPFIVKTIGQDVEVLGTQFNISAYPDNPAIKTTLVEGSVRVVTVADRQRRIFLKPGQQSTLRGEAIDVQAVDVEPYVAWKEGVFVFYNLTIDEMIRQIERWYDVHFDTTNIPVDNSRFSGEIRRDVPLSKLLDFMSHLATPRYRIEGRRVIVYK